MSGAGRKSGERERIGERAWQKTLERERSVERRIEERERSGDRAKSGRSWAAQNDHQTTTTTTTNLILQLQLCNVEFWLCDVSI